MAGPELRSGYALPPFRAAAFPRLILIDAPQTGLRPYWGRSWADGSCLWATAGLSSGEVEIDDAEAGDSRWRTRGLERLRGPRTGGVPAARAAGRATSRSWSGISEHRFPKQSVAALSVSYVPGA